MHNGDRYVIYSANTLYRLPSSTCTEGSTVNLSNTSVNRVYLVNGQWQYGDFYTTGNYNSTSYVCHVWNEVSPKYDVNFLILPATLLVMAFFYIIYKWFIRLRG